MKFPLYLLLLSALVLSRLNAAEVQAKPAVQRTVIPAATIEQLEVNPNIAYALASLRHHLDKADPPLAFMADELDAPNTHADEMRLDLEALFVHFSGSTVAVATPFVVASLVPALCDSVELPG